MLRPYFIEVTIGYGARTRVPRQVMIPVTEIIPPGTPTSLRSEEHGSARIPRWGNATKANPSKGGDAKLSRLTPAPVGARHAGRAAERTPGGHLAQHYSAHIRRRRRLRPVRLPGSERAARRRSAPARHD